MSDTRAGFTLLEDDCEQRSFKHPNSHQEKCKKYKRQIEDLKLDKIELYDKITELEKQIAKLTCKG